MSYDCVHGDHHHPSYGHHGGDFRSGIPGDYFEQVEGTWVEPPFARAGHHGPGSGETHDAACECPHRPAEDGHNAPYPSVSDAMTQVREACKAMSDMCRLVSAEKGLSVIPVFLPPFFDATPGDGADIEVTEWLVLVNGGPSFYESYDKLCEIWESGPESMHDFLSDAADTAMAAQDLASTLGDIFSATSAGEGSGDDTDDGDDGHRHGHRHDHHDGHHHDHHHGSHHGHHHGCRHDHHGHNDHHDHHGHHHHHGGHRHGHRRDW